MRRSTNCSAVQIAPPASRTTTGVVAGAQCRRRGSPSHPPAAINGFPGDGPGAASSPLSRWSRLMKAARDLRSEANALMVEHRMRFQTGPRTCQCGINWPCAEWERAEMLLKKAHFIETGADDEQ